MVEERCPETAASELVPFWRIHESEPILVCGLGPSVRCFEPPSGLVTIGVNDIGRYFAPTYMFSCDPLKRFLPDRRKWLLESGAKIVMKYPSRGKSGKDDRAAFKGQRVVWIEKMGERRARRLDGQLHHCTTSVYPALILAAWMGAPRIGLLGCDLEFRDDPSHPLNNAKSVKVIQGITNLCSQLLQYGHDVRNLSPIGRLQIPRSDLHWLQTGQEGYKERQRAAG